MRSGSKMRGDGVVLLGLLALGWPGGLWAQQHPYDREFPTVNYLRSSPTDRVAALEARLASGRATLRFEPGRGYLRALLEALEIPVSSQMLVFSKTSLQAPLIGPESPRALYFGDDVYVAWVPGSEVIEIAALDPRLGPVFYLLPQRESGASLGRQTDQCLQCHDTYSLTGGGVPRFLFGSGPTGPTGESAAHGSWLLTDQRTAIQRRWGGWYVTGVAPGLAHMGNQVTSSDGVTQHRAGSEAQLPASVELALSDPGTYPRSTSDVVALLVAEHQVTVQNLITRVAWEAAIAPDLDSDRLERAVTELGGALLLNGMAGLTVPVQGASEYAEAFLGRGHRDRQGRSLRELELDNRLFRYPLSYLIGSEAFLALPDPIRHALYRRVTRELSEGAEARTALEVLTETSSDFARWQTGASR